MTKIVQSEADGGEGDRDRPLAKIREASRNAQEQAERGLHRNDLRHDRLARAGRGLPSRQSPEMIFQ